VSFKLVNKKGYRRVSKGQDHHLKSHSVAAALSRFDLSYLVTSTNSVHVMISITFDRILTLGWRSILPYSRVTNSKISFMFNRLVRTLAVIYKLKKEKRSVDKFTLESFSLPF
jgi:hypothetical protein